MSSHPDQATEAEGGFARATSAIYGFGLIVSPMPNDAGDRVFFAEVVPAGSGWRPWPGRTSRWWFEVLAQHAPDEHGVDGTTYAYTPGGRGGAFTLRSCLRKAMQAVAHFTEESNRE